MGIQEELNKVMGSAAAGALAIKKGLEAKAEKEEKAAKAEQAALDEEMKRQTVHNAMLQKMEEQERKDKEKAYKESFEGQVEAAVKKLEKEAQSKEIQKEAERRYKAKLSVNKRMAEKGIVNAKINEMEGLL